MQPQLINKLTPKELNEIVLLHYQNLNESFLNNFGKGFLKLAYQIIVTQKENIFLIVKNDDKIIGYLVATEDGENFNNKVICSNFFGLSLEILKSAVTKPFILFELVGWFLTKRTKSKLPQELQFIAIDTKYQGKGLGASLITSLNKEFKKRGFNFYRVGTKTENENSNNFYKKLGFKFTHQEKLFGDQFNYYTSPTY